ncbi:MAG: ACP S-malonyltransferase [Chlamydiia bacterium]|nr:ACP S-malonyltransferase [Chlamydiia bacterium]
MGRDFYDAYPAARAVFDEADAILGRPLSRIVFEGPEEDLTHTRNSQTGIFVMSMALLAVIHEEFPSLRPSVCAGLSLGSNTAVTASGRMTFATCLPLVQDRGAFMNDACEAHPGQMAVVMGLEAEAVESIVEACALPHDLWAANFNCPGQVVVSGTAKGIEAFTAAAKAAGAKRVLPLQVHGAFHSGLMQDAQDRLAPKVQAASIDASPVELVMNVPGGFVADTAQIRAHLIDQVTSPVRWQQGIQAMEARGVDLYIEIGPGKTLAGMNKRIKTSAPTVSIERVGDLELLRQEIFKLV